MGGGAVPRRTRSSVVGMGCCGADQTGDFGGAAPGEADAGSTVAVVVGDGRSAGVMLEVDLDVGAGWSQPDEVVDDLSVGETRFEADAALRDGLAGGGIGVAVPLAGFDGTAEDHVAGVGIDHGEVGGVAGVGLDEASQPGVGDDDVVAADGVDLVVGDEGVCTEPGAVDDQR